MITKKHELLIQTDLVLVSDASVIFPHHHVQELTPPKIAKHSH